MCSIGNFSGSDTSDSGLAVSSTASLPPSMLSMYLWDACKKGKLFETETYGRYVFLSYVNRFLEQLFQKVVIPPRFDKTRVFERLWKKASGNLGQSHLVDSLESVDPENVESIEQLADESKRKGEEQIENMVEFLKQDVFPPTLWMEFSRLGEVLVECMTFLIKRMKTWSQVKPQKISQVRERSTLTKWMFRPFVGLANCLYEVLLNYQRLYLFMELISCERESELFTEKLWTFTEEQYENFEPILFDFHNSITVLQQHLLEIEPKEITVDFSEPAGWAFKQLVQTVTI